MLKNLKRNYNPEKIALVEKKKQFLIKKLGNKFSLLYSATKKYLQKLGIWNVKDMI